MPQPSNRQSDSHLNEREIQNEVHATAIKVQGNETLCFLDLGGGNECTDMPDSGWHFSMQPSYILWGRIPMVVSWELDVVNLI
jgi:hypothetical protein